MEKKPEISQAGIVDFLGQWTLDISGNKVGWLEIRQEEGYLDGELLWESGSVSPVTNIYFEGNKLYVGRNTQKIVREKDSVGLELRSHLIPTWLEIQKDGEKIKGFLLNPGKSGLDVDSISFTGTKLPEMPDPPDLNNLNFGDPIELFNGKDLSGWEVAEEGRANGWSVENGILINNPVQKEGQNIAFGNLKTEKVFNDFNLKLEVYISENINSGVYLRGMFEIQVFDSYGKKLDPLNMGALYSRITPSVNAEKPAGMWQTMDITLCNRHLTVILNGINIIDNKPVYGPTGGALSSDVFAPGPIMLQGDHGKVSYRNIILKPVL